MTAPEPVIEPEPLVPPKGRPAYRLSRYSILWIVAMLVLIPYELVMVVRGVDGGPLTHVVKWAYGEQGSPRWWLLGWANTGFLLWMPPHFLWEGWGWRSLVVMMGVGLLIGGAGILLGSHT